MWGFYLGVLFYVFSSFAIITTKKREESWLLCFYCLFDVLVILTYLFIKSDEIMKMFFFFIDIYVFKLNLSLLSNVFPSTISDVRASIN